MGAVAAKLGGIGDMRNDINDLKKKMALFEGISNKLKDATKTLTDKSDGVMKAKDEIEGKIGGITGKLDSLKSMNEGLGGQLGGV